MTEQKLLYLSQSDVASLGVPIKEIIDSVQAAFREHGEGHVEMPPKPGVHTQPDAFIHAMPAYIPALHSVGIKWVGGYPENQKRGLPYITGLLILNDDQTGVPLAVMDCTWITAKRTGGDRSRGKVSRSAPIQNRSASWVAASRDEAISKHSTLCSNSSASVAYDTVPEQIDRFAAEIEKRFNLPVTKAKQPREAVDGLDLVVTAGPILHKPHATIKAGWLKEGAFASLVDFDSYWDGAAMQEASKFCTDDVPQLEHYRSIGYFQNIPPIHATVGELVAGKKPGRENAREKTITCNLGLALDDMATAPIVFRRAVERGIGTWLKM
jgi:ornithine cyclodeaminase/alanine dehydrogenase